MGTLPQSGEVRQAIFPQHGEGHTKGAAVILPEMGNNLKTLREERKWTHERAAAEMGVSRGQFIKLERGERRLTNDYIHQAAKAFGVSQADIIVDPEPVPLVGFVGAGAEASFFASGQGPFGEAPPIDGANERTVAVEIRGGSLGPIFDRWLCYYDDRRDPPTEDLLGKLCIVGLEDGRVLVKLLARGHTRGFFTLWSNNEPPIQDVTVAWAAPVALLRPR